MTIAKVEDYNVAINLYAPYGLGEPSDKEITYEPVFDGPAVGWHELYLDAVLKHIKALEKDGIYPIVTVFLPKGCWARLKEQYQWGKI